MKTMILAVLAATVLAGSMTAQAADRRIDGNKVFEDIASRSSNH